MNIVMAVFKFRNVINSLRFKDVQVLRTHWLHEWYIKQLRVWFSGSHFRRTMIVSERGKQSQKIFWILWCELIQSSEYSDGCWDIIDILRAFLTSTYINGLIMGTKMFFCHFKNRFNFYHSSDTTSKTEEYWHRFTKKTHQRLMTNIILIFLKGWVLV